MQGGQDDGSAGRRAPAPGSTVAPLHGGRGERPPPSDGRDFPPTRPETRPPAGPPGARRGLGSLLRGGLRREEAALSPIGTLISRGPRRTGEGEHMATKEDVIGVLRKCYDPEIPINIYDLGLVYNIDLKDEGKVDVKMTLTAPGCPASAYIHQDVKRKLEQLQGVKEAVVNIVWDPPWTPEMMSETAKKQFGWGI